nr:hypothetical protein [Rubrobacter sp.]
WPAEYTTELLNILNVLGRLVDLEESQADLLQRVCSGETIPDGELREAGALDTGGSSGMGAAGQASLLD